MIRYLTSLLLSVTANKFRLDLFQKTNSRERIEQVGIRKAYAPWATFSEEEDRMIISLQVELGNQWTRISDRVNETLGTDWSNDQVMHRFLQLEKEKKEGGRKMRKAVNFSMADDAQIIAFRNDWLETRTTT